MVRQGLVQKYKQFRANCKDWTQKYSLWRLKNPKIDFPEKNTKTNRRWENRFEEMKNAEGCHRQEKNEIISTYPWAKKLRSARIKVHWKFYIP